MQGKPVVAATESNITPARKKVRYEPEAPASAFRRGRFIHSLALRARMVHFLAEVIGEPGFKSAGITRRSVRLRTYPSAHPLPLSRSVRWCWQFRDAPWKLRTKVSVPTTEGELPVILLSQGQGGRTTSRR